MVLLFANDQQNGNTLLSIAARHGYADCVAALIAAGADLEGRNEVRCAPAQ